MYNEPIIIVQKGHLSTLMVSSARSTPIPTKQKNPLKTKPSHEDITSQTLSDSKKRPVFSSANGILEVVHQVVKLPNNRTTEHIGPPPSYRNINNFIPDNGRGSCISTSMRLAPQPYNLDDTNTNGAELQSATGCECNSSALLLYGLVSAFATLGELGLALGSARGQCYRKRCDWCRSGDWYWCCDGFCVGDGSWVCQCESREGEAECCESHVDGFVLVWFW